LNVTCWHCPIYIEGFAGRDHAVDKVRELAHYGTDNRLGGEPRTTQLIAKDFEHLIVAACNESRQSKNRVWLALLH